MFQQIVRVCLRVSVRHILSALKGKYYHRIPLYICRRKRQVCFTSDISIWNIIFEFYSNVSFVSSTAASFLWVLSINLPEFPLNILQTYNIKYNFHIFFLNMYVKLYETLATRSELKRRKRLTAVSGLERIPNVITPSRRVALIHKAVFIPKVNLSCNIFLVYQST